MAAVKKQIKRKIETPRGVFRPAAPRDHEGVSLMFAVAGRVAMVEPDKLEEITATLASALHQLVPPERTTGERCAQLWSMFVRAFQSSSRTPEELSRILYQDLERLGQELELVPMAPWEELPEGIDEPQAVVPQPIRDENAGMTLGALVKKAKSQARKRAKPPLKPETVLALLRDTRRYAVRDMCAGIVQDGEISRNDVRLIERCIDNGHEVGPKDQTLIGCLETIGERLLRL